MINVRSSQITTNEQKEFTSGEFQHHNYQNQITAIITSDKLIILDSNSKDLCSIFSSNFVGCQGDKAIKVKVRPKWNSLRFEMSSPKQCKIWIVSIQQLYTNACRQVLPLCLERHFAQRRFQESGNITSGSTRTPCGWVQHVKAGYTVLNNQQLPHPSTTNRLR